MYRAGLTGLMPFFLVFNNNNNNNNLGNLLRKKVLIY